LASLLPACMVREMAALPWVRSVYRAGRGLRPHSRDLDHVVETLRARLLRGAPLRDPARWRIAGKVPPAFALRRLRGLQLRKLRRTLRHVRQFVPHYRETLPDVELHDLDDLRRLPVTRREDLERAPEAFLSRAPGLTPSVPMSTSGTRGRPIPLWLTHDELDYYASVQAIAGMLGGFLGPHRIAQVSVPLGNSITARLFAEAAQRTGAVTLLPELRGTLDEHLDSILQERDLPGKSRRVTNLLCSPAFLWALTARAEATGRDLSQAALDDVFCFGAKAGDVLRERVERVWGVKMKQGYSLTETLSTGAIECELGRLHFLDGSGVLEVVDPETLEPVPPGGTGLGLITTLYPDRELQPLIRYETNDLIRTSTETTCGCGRPSTLLDEIVGRVDDVFVFGALNMHPQTVGEELVAHPELVQPPRYRVDLERHDAHEACVVSVEVARPLSEERRLDLDRALRHALAITRTQHATVGAIRTEFRFLPAGSLEAPYAFRLVDSLHV